MQLAVLAEVEDVRPEAAHPLGVGLGELEGVADAAILGFQALNQAFGQVVDRHVGLDEHQAHVDEREHLAIPLDQRIEAQGEQLGTRCAPRNRL
ncbi:hypothetical protein D9M73_222030 [compost metagenome]